MKTINQTAVEIDERGEPVLADTDPMPGSSTDHIFLSAGLTMTRIGTNPAEAKVKGRPVHVANLWGRVEGIVTADNDKGDTFEGLGGSFYCENVQSGAKYRGSRAFLPKGLHDVLINGVGEKGREFMFQAVAIPANNPSGYTWAGSLAFDEVEPDTAYTVPTRLLANTNKSLLLLTDGSK